MAVPNAEDADQAGVRLHRPGVLRLHRRAAGRQDGDAAVRGQTRAVRQLRLLSYNRCHPGELFTGRLQKSKVIEIAKIFSIVLSKVSHCFTE